MGITKIKGANNIGPTSLGANPQNEIINIQNCLYCTHCKQKG